MYSWQEWLQLNYKVISTWARRWHHEEWRELLAFMALYLQKNWSKFSKIPDGEERIKWLQTWMKNNVNWSNSEFNKSIAVNNLGEEFDHQEEIWHQEFDILAEDSSEEIKDFIIDLSRRFDEGEVQKILQIRRAYLLLMPHERVLYDLYYTQMLSIRAVAKKLNLPPSAVYGMLNDLKKRIIDLC